ncbi:Nonribosomal peptide synthetase-like protein [Hapsidospora chrysogenum ATCC 11550]|uniref:Nonribosomal peptide synthetase-like protein n=1 Tax=Hapsidospora chrysogenum (strain ATCC 11550 / CBS 779.69 / DSM 880 / IAM 14645 / JCM 23072 / IMI 49137) TaxID=857340 RepID=A0A086T6I0_HAPC1|nr:Nonribosomal peptide synthetase-like protein [Hapsidospora chrysogenum ATCC 11550]
MLNDDGKSYSFDERGDGYGRGEGIATLVLKRLDDAIADGDPIRAIIRNSGINHDGKTNGISYPSPEAQQELAELVYAEAGLDPRETEYVEAHGTGTQAGDKVEMTAIRKVFCENRDSEVLLGSVKANVGHTESTSGIAAVIKTVLMLEKGFIPTLPSLVEVKSSIKKLMEYPVRIPKSPEPWEPTLRKDGSLNFGFGGTNGHVILESASGARFLNGQRLNDHGANGHGANGHQSNGHPVDHRDLNGSSLNGTQTNGASQGEEAQSVSPQLFVFSAKAKSSLSAGVRELQKWITDEKDVDLQSLAYTLGCRRSLMAWRSTCVASTTEDLLTSMTKAPPVRVSLSKPQPIVFLFTGQGAQWYAMGRELLETDSAFRDSIVRSDQILQSLGMTWSLVEELLKDKSSSRMDQSEVAQPASTAVQVALVDMLRKLRIVPQAVLGHSSGEIAAAYAAGALTQAEVMRISLRRSQISQWVRDSVPSPGGMMAVGLGEPEVLPYLERTNGELRDVALASIACVNSPQSTTLTGDRQAVEHVQKLLEKDSVFNRLLRVDTAYHSHHMSIVAPRYEKELGNIQGSALSAGGVRFFSSETTQEKSSGFGSRYWVDNLVSQVRFSEALETLCHALVQENGKTDGGAIAPLFIEVGPHAALKGPFTQTIQALQLPDFDYQYTSVLLRGQDARHSVLAAAGKALELGCPVDVAAVNSYGASSAAALQKVLTTLPPYSWDFSTRFWHESRLSASYRFRHHPYHDILGLRVVSGNSIHPTWRQILSVDRQPWLRDHVIDNFKIFPGSGYMCMAIEAVLQLASEVRPGQANPLDAPYQVKLRDVRFLKALVVPDSPGTVEVQLLLTGGDDVFTPRDFSVVSISPGGQWAEHCCGSVFMISGHGADANDVEGTRESGIAASARAEWLQRIRSTCTETFDHDTIYAEMKANGNTYGPTFADIQHIKLGDHRGVATVEIPNVISLMPGQHMHPHRIHPSTLDAIAHALIPVKSQARKSGSVMPTSIGELTVSSLMPNQPGHLVDVAIESTSSSTTKAVVVPKDDASTSEPLLSISGMETVAIGETQHLEDPDSKLKRPLHIEWEEDADFFSARAGELTSRQQLEEHVSSYISRYVLKKPSLRILEAEPAAASKSLVKASAAALGAMKQPIVSYSICARSPEAIEELKSSFEAADDTLAVSARFEVLDLSQGPQSDGRSSQASEAYDMVILNYDAYATAAVAQVLSNVRAQLRPGGALLFVGEGNAPGNMSQMLNENSFSSPEPATVGLNTHESPGLESFYCVVSIALASQRAASAPSSIQIIPDLQGKLRDFASQLSDAISNDTALEGVTSAVVPPSSSWLPEGSIDPAATYIILDEGTSPLLLEPSSSIFAELRSLAFATKSVLWVSMRSDGKNSESESDMLMATGFTRVIRKEIEGLKLVTLTVKQDLANHSAIIQAVSGILKVSFIEARDRICELEYQYNNNAVVVPRLRVAPHYERWSQGRAAENGDAAVTEDISLARERPLKLEVEVPGLLSSMRFTDDGPRTSLGDHEVEVQAQSYGVNSNSVEMAMGHLNEDQATGPTWVSEWAGVVTAVGAGLSDKWKVGDQVCGLGGAYCEPYANVPRIKGPDLELMRPLPSSMLFADASASLLAYTTAWLALNDIARLAPGRTVLVHSAETATGQAAVLIAQLLGADVFATVKDAQAKSLVVETLHVAETNVYSSQHTTFKQGVLRQTADRGVDVILNSLDDFHLQENWDALAPFGTFFELREGHKSSMQAPFGKNATFTSLGLGLLIRQRPDVVGKAMDKVIDLINEGKITSIHSTQILPIGQIETAFRLVSKGPIPGKVVLEVENGAIVRATVPKPSKLNLSADGTYVVPGGLGSLGEKICVWLAVHGAKHIVALNRSGTTRYPEDLVKLEKELEKHGAKLYRPACDVTDEARVREIAAWCAANLPPVRAIIQSAASFVDKVLENMTGDNFNNGVRPKRDGTMNIYNAFVNDQLEAVVLLSSAAGVLGSKGQTHYNTGNAFQEGFGLQKVAEQAASGLKTHFTVIQPALITGSDADVTGAHRRKMFHRQGGVMVTFSEVLALIEYSMGEQARQDGYTQLVLGVDPSAIPDDGTFNLRFMNDIVQPQTGIQEAADDTGAARSVGTASAGQMLRAAAGDREQMQKVVVEAIASRIRELVAISGDDLGTSMPLVELGVDSLVAIELKNWISRELEASLQTSQILDAASIASLAAIVVETTNIGKNPANGTEVNGANGDAANAAHPDAAEAADARSANTAKATHGHECCAASKELPVMPLLDLDTICDLYYKAIEHLMTPEQRAHLLDQFRMLKQPGGLGRKLHARLMQRFQDPTIDNWLFEPANEQVYTGRNYPLSPWGGMAGPDGSGSFPHRQAERAAIVSLSALKFKRILEAGKMEPTVIGGRPQCTYMHNWLFNTYREPVVGVDRMQKMPPKEYIAVLRKGHMFRVDPVGDDGAILPFAKLEAAFQAIIDKDIDNDAWESILTADDRNSWARSALEAHPDNRLYLDMVQGAMFLVCLDEAAPTNSEERMDTMLLNRGFNRWYDKGLKLIVCSNGVSGMHVDHSMIDGMTIRELYEARTEAIKTYKRDDANNQTTNGVHEEAVQVQQYPFHASPDMLDRIRHIRERYIAETSNIGFTKWTCDRFGQDYFQSIRMPAKGIYETMVQLGSKYYLGRNEPCWSAISMGHYHKGRIDIIQTFTREMQSFCNVVDDADVEPSLKLALLKDAARSHGVNIQRAMQGKGYERQLVALETQLREGEEKPTIYTDPVYQAMRPHWVMTGSTDIGSAGGGEFGFILRHPDSVWLQYLIEPDKAYFIIVMKKDERERFVASMEKAAAVVQGLLDIEAKS